MHCRSNIRRACALFLLLIASTTLCTAAQAPIDPVFRIGAFNRSSGEFSQDSPTGAVNFIVNKSDPAKDWYAHQPAAQAAESSAKPADPAAAPRAITFMVGNAPAPYYQLHLAVLIESSSVPALRIGINGREGVFYLHPKLDYSNGDQGDSFDPAYSAADLMVTFPGSFLKRGANSITLQPVEEADEAVPGAELNYDAIELDRLPGSAAAPALDARLEATIFYKQQKDGLKECVAAYVRYGRKTAPGSADLSIGDQHLKLALHGGSFGEEKLEFLASEFAPGSEARLVLAAGGHTRTFRQTIDPAKRWTIFVVPHIHVDVGYSDYQAKVAAIQSRTIDEALAMMAQHKDFRFSLDGEWDLQQFLETHSAEKRAQAIDAIRKRELFVPAQYANLLTGICSAETLIRSLYPSANFSRLHGTPLNYANITDVPSWSWSYASILASAGISYLAAGSNNYRAPVLLQGRLNEDSPLWWQGPDGQRVLLWYSRHYMQMQMLFGLPPVIAAGHDTLPLFLEMYEHTGYRANAVILYGTQVENTDLFPQQAELAAQWNSVYAYPHLEYSGFHEALAAIAGQFGNDLPSVRGDGGPYWEDGAGSDAYYLAMERRNEARALSAEKFDTLTGFVNQSLRADTTELDRMWTTMVLMDEHTWDSSNSISQPTSAEAVDQLAVKDQYAVNAAAQVDWIARRSMANLANSIAAGQNSLIVFNSLNWKRSGLVAVDLDKGDEIVDATTEQPVWYEVLRSGNGFSRVRFVASNVPALGYKVYALRHSEKAGPAAAAETGSTMENEFYKIALDPATGSVRSIYDKQLHRELVNQHSPYRFGEYLYVTGGDKQPNTLLHYDRISPRADLSVHAAQAGRIVSIARTPYGEVARLESRNMNAPRIDTEIRLFEHAKKIELVVHLDKKATDDKEAAYFAFPFAMEEPEFQYEIQNGVVDPARDMIPGAGHEWFSVQHWVAVQQDGVSAAVMPLDAPLVTLGDINRGAWPESFGRRPGTIFSYVMNNYWDTNYRAAQGGHFIFRYVVTSADTTNAADLSRVGWEEATPLELDLITSQDKALPPAAAQAAAGNMPANLDGKEASLLTVSDPKVLLETWKPAEDGNGTILRFVDLGGTERTVMVTSPLLHLASVTETDALERGQRPLPIDSAQTFHFTIHPHQIVTIRAVEARPR